MGVSETLGVRGLSEPASRASAAKAQIWTGRVLSALVVLFMLFDGVTKLMQLPPVVEATAKLGYPPGSVILIGSLALLCVVVYAIPRTAVLGAVLLTGYLGGAIASQVRVSAGAWPVGFALGFAALAWAGLWLRDERLRRLLRERP